MKASWQARVAAFVTRRRVRPALADMADIASVRKVFNTALPAPRGVRYTDAVLGGVPGEWVEAVHAIAAGTDTATPTPTPTPTASTTLLYLHGGGFVGCSPRSHRSITAALALQGLRVFGWRRSIRSRPRRRMCRRCTAPCVPSCRPDHRPDHRPLAAASGWAWLATAPAATWRWD
jgi:hypothetical protein